MKILVVSGFLGSGKTTFIRKMIEKTGKPLVVLENEYGDTSLDAAEIRQAGDDSLNVMEFMEGCVCCTQKDSFANSLIAISASLDPEYLVVEPSGVGRLSNIMRIAGSVTWEKIRLLRPVVILSPLAFQAQLSEYGSIYEDQVRNAGHIVFSHMDHVPGDMVPALTETIRKLNPEAEITTSPYGQLDAAWFNRLFMEAGDLHVDEMAEPGADLQLDQYTLKNVCLRTPADLIMLMENLLHGALGNIPRAKGTVACGDEWFRFDLASGQYAVTGSQDGEHVPQCVFIGTDIRREAILSYFEVPEETLRNEWFRFGMDGRSRKKTAEGDGTGKR